MNTNKDWNHKQFQVRIQPFQWVIDYKEAFAFEPVDEGTGGILVIH